MTGEQAYWNPFLETMDRERLEALQLRKFRRILDWAYEHSAFHRTTGPG